jgi:hypothetical protein
MNNFDQMFDKIMMRDPYHEGWDYKTAAYVWEECKRQVIETLKNNEFEVRTQRGGFGAIDIKALKDVAEL